MIEFTSFSEFELNESLNNPVEFYLTDDTKLPSLIRAGFSIGNTEYVVSVEEVKFKSNGLYQVELMRVVSKKGRRWSFKTASDARIALATMLKILEASIPFIGARLRGFVISMPKKVADRAERFATKIVKRSYITSFRVVPVVYDPNSDKGKERFVVVVRKPLDPKQVFAGTVFKNYDFDGSVNASALEGMETKRPKKVSVSTTPSKTLVFGKAEVSLDFGDPELDGLLEDIKNTKPERIFDAAKQVLPPIQDLDPKSIKMQMGGGVGYFSSQENVFSAWEGPAAIQLAYLAAPASIVKLKQMWHTEKKDPIPYYEEFAKNFMVEASNNSYSKGKVHKYLKDIGMIGDDLKPTQDFLFNIFAALPSKGTDINNYKWDDILNGSKNLASYISMGEGDNTKSANFPKASTELSKVAVEYYYAGVYLLIYYFSDTLMNWHIANINKKRYDLEGKGYPFFYEYLKDIPFDTVNKELNSTDKLTTSMCADLVGSGIASPNPDGTLTINDVVFRDSITLAILSGYKGMVTYNDFVSDMDNFRANTNKMYENYASIEGKLSFEKNIPVDVVSDVENMYGSNYDPKNWKILDHDTDYSKVKKFVKEDMGYSGHYIRSLPGFEQASDYTGSSYSNFNAALRNVFKVYKEMGEISAINVVPDLGDPYSNGFKSSMFLLKMFDAIKPLSHSITVYRYGNFGHNKYDYSDENIEERIFSHDMIDPGFISASLSPSFSWSGRVKVKIHIPAGAKVIPILDESLNAGEEEIILPPLSVIRPYRIRKNTKIISDTPYLVDAIYMGSGYKSFKNTVLNILKDEKIDTSLYEAKKEDKKNEEQSDKFLTQYDPKAVSVIEKLIRLGKLKITGK